jgi:hypothetical protein
MAMEQVPATMTMPERRSYTPIFIAIFILLTLLGAGEIVSLSRIRSMESGQAQLQKQLNEQLASKIAAIENSNAQQLSALKAELDQTAASMGATGKQLSSARAMVARLARQQRQEAAELARKADEEKVGAIAQDVSATKTDLDTTKKSVDELSKDLGMAKSEFGTLIARNHDDIEALRKLGERDYFEFTLSKNQRQTIAGVGVTLKKTNVKHNRFDLVLLADDMTIEKKGRTVNEPIFFYTAGSKKPYELVVNKVSSNSVTGYISTPKGATEMASRGSAS